MSYILKMCFAVLLALLVSNLSVSVQSASVSSVETSSVPVETTSALVVDSANVSTAAPKKRETDNQSDTQTQTTTKKPINYCDPSLSCGWAVYTAFTREIRYFMKNSCECPENQHCVRVDDDAVISAFVYKCRVKRSTLPPPTSQ